MQKPPGNHFHLPGSLPMGKMYRSLSLLPVCLSAATSDFPWCLLDKWALLLEEHPSPQRAYQSSTAAATIPSTDSLSAASGLCLHKHEIFWGQKRIKKEASMQEKAYGSAFTFKVKGPPLCVQSGPTLFDPVDYKPPGSSVPGVFQARTQEQVAISFSRGSSWSRDWIGISCIFCLNRQMPYLWVTWEANNVKGDTIQTPKSSWLKSKGEQICLWLCLWHFSVYER